MNVWMAVVRSVASLPGMEPHCAGPRALGATRNAGSAIDMQYHLDRWSETRMPRLLPRAAGSPFCLQMSQSFPRFIARGAWAAVTDISNNGITMSSVASPLALQMDVLMPSGPSPFFG